MPLRFSFDLGSSSIGWAVFATDPWRLVDLGARLYSDGRDPQKGESLGKARREPKAARRRQDRALQRRRYLLSLLEEHDLLPGKGEARNDIFKADPYALRAKAPSEKITLHELGRVLWHLNRRRGFKSNRKADNQEDDAGKIATGAERLRAHLDEGGYATVGQFLASRQAADRPENRKPVRIRLNGKGASANYDFYPQRAMVEAEFDAVWTEQANHHPQLSDMLRDKLRSAIFFQRDLKPVLPGRCTFYPDEYRLPRSREIAQEFIIRSQLGALRIDAGDGERPLTFEECEKLAEPLLSGKKLTWTGVRKLLNIGATPKINLEDGGEKALHVNPVPGRFEGTKKKPGAFPEGWSRLDAAKREAIIEKLDPTPPPGAPPPAALPDEEIAAWACAKFGLDEAASTLLARTVLPDGHLNLSEKAVREILPHLHAPDENGFARTYADAAKAAGINHFDLEDGEWYERLPPYNQVPALQRHIGFGTGDLDDPPDIRFGRIPNPTVHIALNQLRRVVNALIDRYGRPDEIVIEVARELKLSQKQKEQRKKLNEENRKANNSRRDDLVRNGHIEDGAKRIRDKLLRMRLWEELGPPNERRCPYTGEMISLARLMSDEIEIEHILPFARTLDDSPANKTVSLLRANRIKRNLSPGEAATRHPTDFNLDEMRARARTMPPNKRWRFEADAMERFEREERDFVDRQLHATGHLSRLARGYLMKLFPPVDDLGKRRVPVWVVTGQLTAKLRNQWSLNLGDHNRKNRNDHRHHALDAAVIGVIDRSLLQKIAALSAREAERGADVDRLIAGLAEPYEDYIDQVLKRIDTVLAVPRAEHGQVDPTDSGRTSGKLHEDTYYGAVRDKPANADDLKLGNVVRRKPVVDLTSKEIDHIRDPKIRAALQAVRDEASADKKALAEALATWSEATGMRRVRVLKPEAGVVAIKDRRTGNSYKYVTPAENAWLDIIETPDGNWRAYTVDIFAANTERKAGWTDAFPDGRFIMRLRKGDAVQLFDDDGKNRVKRVHRLSPSNNIVYLADINEGGDLPKRHKEEDDPFRWDFANIGKMKDRRTRRVRFTPAGRMKTVPYGRQ